jgi:hypothetical protein
MGLKLGLRKECMFVMFEDKSPEKIFGLKKGIK